MSVQMNLIEQLGGYEKAKIRLGSCDITLAYYQELDRQLLEHRRTNNIFEVGDAIVRKWNNQVYYLIVDIDNDGQEFLIHRDKNAKFKDCKVSDNVCNFTHATPQEIKAGKRL